MRGLKGQELQDFLTPLGLDAKLGRVYSKPHSLYEHDLLGIGGSARLSPFDLGRVIAKAALVVTADPGVILVSKDPIRQNFVTGTHFSLPLAPHQSAQVDGLVAYCIDHDRGQPTGEGPGYDVLGSAGAIGGEAMDALQRVADVVAAREPGPLQETPGAGDAIWRVSADAGVSEGPEDDPARTILQAAGAPAATTDKTYAAPRFSDPNTAVPGTGALSLTGPVTLPPDPREGAEPPASAVPRLTGLAPSTRHLRLRARQRVVVLGARVTLTGAADAVSLRLTRRRAGRTLTVGRSRARSLAVGAGALTLVARGLRPGRYLLVAVATRGGRLSAAITVSGSPGARRAGQ